MASNDLASGICTQECALYGHGKQPELNARALTITDTDLPVQSEQAKSLYTSINDWQTRIVQLEPGTSREPLKADLHVADMIYHSGVVLHAEQRKVEYKALSYCWGQPEFNKTIVCNGIVYPITKNLHDALRRLRSRSRTTYVWVDAICINQHDDAERSMQVANMLLIFKKAYRVSVWLGEYGERTELSLSWIIVMLEEMSKTDLRSDSVKEKILSDLQRLVCSSHAQNLVKGLADAMNSPWFQRMWVYQEVWIAKVIEVRCGIMCVPWHDLQVWASVMDEVASKYLPQRSPVDWKITYTNRLRAFHRATSERELQNSQPELPVTLKMSWTTPERYGQVIHDFGLLQVLIRTQGNLCADLRDQVYGVLGMSSTNFGPRKAETSLTSALYLPVDYHRTISEVFQDAAKYIFKHDGWLSLLHLDATFGGDVGGEPLPSWCPNWTLPMGIMSVGFVELSEALLALRYPTEDEPVDLLGITLGQTEGILRLCGREIGVVDSVEDGYYNHSLKHAINVVKTFQTPRSVKRQSDYIEDMDRRFGYGQNECLFVSFRKEPNVKDRVVAIRGCAFPLILRNQADRSTYEFIGWTESVTFDTSRRFLKVCSPDELQWFDVA